MNKQEAIKIAQNYIDNNKDIQATISGHIQFMDEWIMDAYLQTVDHPVWVVFAENLKKGPFLDGMNEYSLVISTKTKKVEDVRLS